MAEKNIKRLRHFLGEHIKEESENLILVKLHFSEVSMLSVIEHVESIGFEVLSASSGGGFVGAEDQFVIRK